MPFPPLDISLEDLKKRLKSIPSLQEMSQAANIIDRLHAENLALSSQCASLRKCYRDEIKKIETIQTVVQAMKAADEGEDFCAHKDWLACHDVLYQWVETGRFEWGPDGK